MISIFLSINVFLVTIGVPIFDHECSKENNHYTRYFSYSDNHCESQTMPKCCRIEKTKCCKVKSTIVALKIDQEKYSNAILKLPSIGMEKEHALPPMAFFNPLAAREIHEFIHPPPKLLFGKRMLITHQVFRL